MQAVTRSATCRRCLGILVLGACGLVLVRVCALEPFLVPSGSMAPALYGHHRLCTCPCCGSNFPVGRQPRDTEGQGRLGCYLKAACPNCGEHPVAVGDLAETCGDQVLVDKTAYVLRSPRRWEIVVLRLFGAFFIKRLVGLPGEELLLREGDVFVDGRLARKSFAQAQAMRLPVFDHDHSPGHDGWPSRWECEPVSRTSGQILNLDGRSSPCTLTYRHFFLDEGKAGPLTDEYAYNSGAHAGVEVVHDFSFEADIAVQTGHGILSLRLCDGQDWAEVEVPVGPGCARACFWPIEAPGAVSNLPVPADGIAFETDRRYHVDMALVDRRLSIAIDGIQRLSVDLPEPRRRYGVVTPVQFRADGAALEVRHFRLYRDVHYSQHGENAVRGQPVRLQEEQYFVLGDNSPDSEDSRFWADQGRVGADRLVGKPFLIHLPSRRFAWPGRGSVQVPDWSRIRWLR
jgi:signal peptidase I